MSSKDMPKFNVAFDQSSISASAHDSIHSTDHSGNVRRRVSAITWDRRGSAATKFSMNDVIDGAKDATEQEHQMGLLRAVRTYPKAVGWSVLASTAIVMEGYDVQVIYSFLSLPAFTKRYGASTPDGTYQISAPWQSGLTNASCVGTIMGLLTTGLAADRYGYRKTIAGGLILMVCFIFITFFAPNIETLLVGEFLCGIPWGAFQTITTSYAAEVSPVALRPYLTSYVNICWVIGQLIGSGVLRALVGREDEWAYRIPFAIQWAWPLPLLIGIGLAPESPWWLIRKGRLEDAQAAVERLTTTKHEPDFDSQKAVAMMIHTNETEKKITSGTSYLDCLRGVDLRRTEICCMVWACQTLCGGGLMGFAAYFYEQAGLSSKRSFDLVTIQFGMGAIGVVLSWVLMSWYGRRTLYIAGLASLFTLLFTIGIISLVPQSTATAWATGSMLLIYAFVYDFTVGPVCYALVSEMASTRLRQKSIVLARTVYMLFYIINNILVTRQLNPTAWDWAGKAGFFWAGSCFLCLVWAYFRLPETKSRTYAELDALFERKVPARLFATTPVSLFDGARRTSTHTEEKIVLGACKE